MKLFHRKATKPAEPTAGRAGAASDGEPIAASTARPVEVRAVEPTAAAAPAPTPAPAGRADRSGCLFEDWMSSPLPDPPIRVVRVDQDGAAFVVRAEAPGLDPDRDLELTVADGVLWVDARHRDEDTSEEHGFVHHQVRCGACSRSFSLPAGVTAADIAATFEDGVLEIRVPAAGA